MTADLVVPDIEEELVRALEQRAAANGRSPEEEHREILKAALSRARRRSVADIFASMPDVGVMRFFRSTSPAERYVAVQPIGGIRRGVENIRRPGVRTQALQLEAWLNAVVVEYYAKVLSFYAEDASLGSQ